MKKTAHLFLITATFSMLLSGCISNADFKKFVYGEYPECDSQGDTAELSIDAISLENNFKKYKVIPHESVDSKNIQYQKFLSQIKFSLNESGFQEDEINPEIAIIFYYGIGKPIITTRTFAIPIFGTTGYSAASTHGTISTWGNSASYSQTTTLTPQTGIVGAVPHQTTEITYERYLSLLAYDLVKTRKDKAPAQIWETSILSVGESNDLRKVFPFMSVVLKDYANKDNGQRETIQITDYDSRFCKMKLALQKKPTTVTEK